MNLKNYFTKRKNKKREDNILIYLENGAVSKDGIRELLVDDKKNEFLSQQCIAYKFSKSKKEFAKYFTEKWYFDYPEMSIIESAKSSFSFCVNKELLLQLAIYGDQLTQIVIDKRFPSFSKWYTADIEKDGVMWDGFRSNIITTGLNIRLTPSILADMILVSDSHTVQHFYHNTSFLRTIYEKINRQDLLDFVTMTKNIYDECQTNFSDFKEKIRNLDIIKETETLQYYENIYKEKLKEIKEANFKLRITNYL